MLVRFRGGEMALPRKIIRTEVVNVAESDKREIRRVTKTPFNSAARSEALRGRICGVPPKAGTPRQSYDTPFWVLTFGKRCVMLYEHSVVWKERGYVLRITYWCCGEKRGTERVEMGRVYGEVHHSPPFLCIPHREWLTLVSVDVSLPATPIVMTEKINKKDPVELTGAAWGREE